MNPPHSLQRIARFAALVAVSAGLAAAQSPAPQTPGEQTAAQAFKNIQVLKDYPASELRPTMQFIASSLGVGCNFCHAVPDFASDAKPQKATARRMMQMVLDINKNNFDGRSQVSCYTCHQGSTQPRTNPPVMDDLPPGAVSASGGPGGGFGGRGGGGFGGRGGAAAGPPPPAAGDIAGKYVAAIGGTAAVSAIQSVRIVAQRVETAPPGRGGSGEVSETIEVQAPDKFLIADTRGTNTTKTGSDGTAVWTWDARRGTGEAAADAVPQAQMEAQLYAGADLQAASDRVFPPTPMPIGDHTAYRVMQRGAAGTPTMTFYFDSQSGLLLRVEWGAQTILGALPVRVDYSDYRAVNGVQMPFHQHWSTADGSWDLQISNIDVNPTLPASDFTAPAKP